MDAKIALKQELNRVMTYTLPARKGLDLFVVQVAELLRQANNQATEHSLQLHLQTWISGTRLEAKASTPESFSSPVCYATERGLREDFQEFQFKALAPIPPNFTLKYKGGVESTICADRLAAILRVTQRFVEEVLRSWLQNQPVVPTALSKQIEIIVHQLYGIIPR